MTWLILDWKGRMVAQFSAASVRDAMSRYRASGYARHEQPYHLIVKPTTSEIQNHQGA
jgi:hypothetical protein